MIKGFARGALFLIFMMGLCTWHQGCCYFSGTCRKQVNTDLVNCAEGALFSVWTAIIPDVEKVVLGGSPDWQKDAGLLETKFGVDAVTCSLAHVLDDVKNARRASSQTSSDIGITWQTRLKKKAIGYR